MCVPSLYDIEGIVSRYEAPHNCQEGDGKYVDRANLPVSPIGMAVAWQTTGVNAIDNETRMSESKMNKATNVPVLIALEITQEYINYLRGRQDHVR